MKPGSARWWIGTALAALVLGSYVWLAVQVYRSGEHPETFEAWSGPLAWIVGPPARDLLEAAREHSQAGLSLLNDTERPPAERIRAYRAELEQAEALLLRSLRAQPAQAAALAQLAAVRWELRPPLTEDQIGEHLEMIALASTMAPAVPRVQLLLGELTLKMARREEATAYLRRAVELDPTSAGDAVQMLWDHLFGALEILEVLPEHPSVLLALRGPCAAEGRESELIATIEPWLERPDAPLAAALVSVHGDLCLRTGNAQRLLDALERWGPFDDPAARAQQHRQRSRALRALGDLEAAVAAARQARRQVPGSPTHAEFLGDLLARTGDHPAAVATFREALGLAARGADNVRSRARLYRKLGQAEEAAGNRDRAYDAYGMALSLDPDEAIARERLSR